jgi:hypothetical protein
MTIVRVHPRPVGIALIQWDGDLEEVHLRMGSAVATLAPTGECDLYGDGTVLVPVGDYIFTPSGIAIDEAALYTMYQHMPTGVGAYAFSEDIPTPVVLAHRIKAVPCPQLNLGQAVTLSVAWDTPMPNANYSVTITPSGATTVVGALAWTLVDGSVTPSGCQIRIKAPLIGLSLGAVTLSVRADSN